MGHCFVKMSIFGQDMYILKRGETAIGLEGFVIVLDQYVLLLSLDYAEPSCHYLIGSTLDVVNLALLMPVEKCDFF